MLKPTFRHKLIILTPTFLIGGKGRTGRVYLFNINNSTLSNQLFYSLPFCSIVEDYEVNLRTVTNACVNI